MTLALLLILSSCSSAEKQELERSVHSIHRFAWETLRVRRPAAEGADPKAIPGGEDWQSRPLPNEHLDCRTVSELLSEAEPELAAVRDCLLGLKEPVDVAYRLRREPQPYLELEEQEKAPECVRKTLARIAAPREIFFQSTEEGSLRCYSARIDLSSDRVPVFGVKWPLTRTIVRSTLSASLVSREKPDTIRHVLSGLALGPFFGATGLGWAIPAKIVPDALCRRCLGEKNMLTPSDPPPRLWPE